MWPKNTQEIDFEVRVEKPTLSVNPMVDDIVTIAEHIILQIDSDDVEGLLEEHSEELSTEDFSVFWMSNTE